GELTGVTGASSGYGELDVNGSAKFDTIGAAGFEINKVNINGDYTLTLNSGDMIANQIIPSLNNTGTLDLKASGTLTGSFGSSGKSLKLIQGNGGVTITLDNATIYATNFDAGNGSVVAISNNVSLSGDVSANSDTIISNNASLSITGNSIFNAKIDGVNSATSVLKSIPGAGNTITFAEVLGTKDLIGGTDHISDLQIGAGDTVLQNDTTTYNVTFIEAGCLSSTSANGINGDVNFAGYNGTLTTIKISPVPMTPSSYGAVTTTAKNTGNVVITGDTTGIIGASGLPIKSLTVATTIDAKNDGSDLYVTTLNVGGGNAHSYLLSGNAIGVTDVVLGKYDSLILSSASTPNISGTIIGSDAGNVTGNLIIGTTPDQTTLPATDIQVDTLVLSGGGNVDSDITPTKSPNIVMIASDITIKSTGVLSAANSGVIFIANGQTLTDESGAVTLGTGAYISDQFSVGKITAGKITATNLQLSLAGLSNVSVGSGTYVTKAGGTLPQIGASGSALTNLVLSGTSSTIHKASGVIYATNTSLTNQATLKLTGNLDIQGDLTTEDETSLDLSTNTLTLSNNGSLTTTGTLNISTTLTSSAVYGQIAAKSSKVIGTTLVINITNDSYQPDPNTDFQLFSAVDGEPTSYTIIDNQNKNNVYSFLNGVMTFKNTTANGVITKTTTISKAQLEINSIKSAINQLVLSFEPKLAPAKEVLNNLASKYETLNRNTQQFLRNIKNTYNNSGVDTIKRVVNTILYDDTQHKSSRVNITHYDLMSSINRRLGSTFISNIATNSGANLKKFSDLGVEDGPISAGSEDSPNSYGAWVDYGFSNAKQFDYAGAGGYYGRSKSYSFGADTLIDDLTRVGAVANMNLGATKIKDPFSDSRLTSRTYSFSLYGVRSLHYDFYVRWDAFYSSTNSYSKSDMYWGDQKYTSYSTSKSIGLGAGAGLGFSRIAPKTQIIISPEISLRKSYGMDNPYKRYYGYLNILFDQRESNTFEGAFSTSITRSFGLKTPDGVQNNITPYLSFGVAHKIQDRQGKTKRKIEGDDLEFTSENKPTLKTMFNVGAGVSIERGMFEYSGNLGAIYAKKFKSNSGSLKVKISF
ncbi:MAG: autotransporter domain-containing protein, partial [Rickettsiaceae bacterium]|nr:autotransporter domain-containing protein [Rickettsiaceae bacterium]